MKNLKIKRITETILSTKVGVVFEKKNCSWMLCVSKSGFFFCNETNSDFITIYDDNRWACDFPERIPQYVKSAFESLLKKYGEDYLNQFSENFDDIINRL